MGQSYGRGLDILLGKHKDNKKRVDTLKLYRDSVKQAMSDGLFTQDEKEMLEGLGNNLGIPEEEQEIIIGEVLGETGAKEGEKAEGEEGGVPSPSMGYGAAKADSEVRNLTIERDALLAELKIMKEDEVQLMKQLEEMGEKIKNRNKEINLLRQENENLKKEFMDG